VFLVQFPRPADFDLCPSLGGRKSVKSHQLKLVALKSEEIKSHRKLILPVLSIVEVPALRSWYPRRRVTCGRGNLFSPAFHAGLFRSLHPRRNLVRGQTKNRLIHQLSFIKTHLFFV
jgi:hypothetical protein